MNFNLLRSTDFSKSKNPHINYKQQTLRNSVDVFQSADKYKFKSKEISARK